MIRLVFVVISTLSLSSLGWSTCFEQPENSVPSCGFESQAQVDDWTVYNGQAELTHSIVHSGFGAISITARRDGGEYKVSMGHDCFPILESDSGTSGFHFFLVEGAQYVTCKLSPYACPESDCSGLCEIRIDIPRVMPVGEWSIERMTTNWGPVSATVGFSCRSYSPFTMVVDDAFWGEGMVPVELQSFSVD